MATKTVVSNQKKRALEALERRFAVAKVEAQHQQIRNKRRCHELNQGLKSAAGPLKSSLEAAPAGKKDLEAENLTYSCISQPVHDNLLSAIEIPNKETSTVDKILHELLQKGDSAQKYVQGSRGVKVDNWILLDNFVQGHSTSAAQLRALQGNSKRSRNHMSLKQLKKHGLLNLPEEYHKYESFMPMHEMWKEYVMQLLKNAGKNQAAQCLLGADLHGAILRVVECKVDSLIGVVGIMIRETAETFGIIVQDNKFRGRRGAHTVAPRKGSGGANSKITSSCALFWLRMRHRASEASAFWILNSILTRFMTLSTITCVVAYENIISALILP